MISIISYNDSVAYRSLDRTLHKKIMINENKSKGNINHN